MSITSRTESTTRWALKTQRRIALAQAVFWPALVGTGVVVGAVVLLVWRGRRPAPSVSADTTEEQSSHDGSTEEAPSLP